MLSKKSLILISILLSVILAFAIIECQKENYKKLNTNVDVFLNTHGSSCQMNSKNPIEIKIINNTDKIIIKSDIKYSSYEIASKMYLEHANRIFKSNQTIESKETFVECIASPTLKNYHTLTKEDIQKDGESIKKSFVNARVGFNIYSGDYGLKVEEKQFEFK